MSTACIYSREAVGAYDDLVKLGLRTKSKELASDYAVVQRQVPEQTRSMIVRELRSELEPIAKSKNASYSLEERKAAFRLLNGLEALPSDTKLQVAKDLRQELRAPRFLLTQMQERAKVHGHEKERGRELER